MDDSAHASAGSGAGGCCLKSYQQVPHHQWSAAVECHDVALTADGRALLAAAGVIGLLEFDATSGVLLSTWQPPPMSDGAEQRSVGSSSINRVRVCSVDALPDGRVAVAGSYPRFVDILRRDQPESSSSDQWVCERRIACVQASANLLAVHDDFLAVAEYEIVCDPSNAFRTLRLPRFALIAVSTGQLRLRQGTDYFIGKLAVTEQAVITAGRDPLPPLTAPLSPTESEEKCWLMDSYSHTGERMWSVRWTEAVADIVPSAAGEPPVLYVALPGGSRVVAVSRTDGRLLSSVLSAYDTPRSIACCATGNDFALAVLGSDGKTVAIHLAICDDEFECPLR